MNEKINLLVCYIFNDTVYAGSLSTLTLANAGPNSVAQRRASLWSRRGEKGRHKGQRRKRSERTISQIIWKDYRGFSQITLSTEGETEIKRPGKGQHFSTESYTIYLILIAAGSFTWMPCDDGIKTCEGEVASFHFTGRILRWRQGHDGMSHRVLSLSHVFSTVQVRQSTSKHTPIFIFF